MVLVMANSGSLLDQIGRTPLLRLTRLASDLPAGVEVWAKGEHLNPGGSVKDRAAKRIIEAAIASGELTPHRSLLDATSGNTGIAYAMIGAALGYRVTLCLPKNAGAERKRLLRAYGAEIVETNPLEGTDGAQVQARQLADQDPGRYCYVDQYNNPANWTAHAETTAPEIWEQSGGRVTHFVAGLGTTGTFVGTARGLKQFNPTLRAVSIQPDGPLHGLEGMKHLATACLPGIYDPSVADTEATVTTEEALKTTRRLAREEGLLVGPSAGANVFAALRLARSLTPPALVVTVLCDTGSRYLDAPWWEGSPR